MFRGKRKTILSAVLVAVLLAGSILLTALAAPPTTEADSSYTVMVKYYDSVRIDYKLHYPNDDIFNSGADVPIGGVGYAPNPGSGTFQRVLASQVYCVDPFVAFGGRRDNMSNTWIGPTPPLPGTLSNINSDIYNAWINSWNNLPTADAALYTANYLIGGERWGATTTHYKSGYVATAQWSMSDAMRKHADAIRWLTFYGYRGDFRAHDQESKDSVARLKSLYNGTISDIDKTVALMATKYAIWTVLTDSDPTVLSLNGSSLQNKDKGWTEWHEKFVSLYKAMVSDATGTPRIVPGAAPGINNTVPTELNVVIDGAIGALNSPASVLSGEPGYEYYGPFTVKASIDGLPELQSGYWSEVIEMGDVFLPISGPTLGTPGTPNAVSFVDENLAPIVTEGLIHGTKQTAQYLPGDSFKDPPSETTTSIEWESEEFYLRIPDSRKISTSGTSSEQLTIWARGKVADVPVAAGTPVVLAYDDKGEQDWNAIQAFIGATAEGATINLYGEDSLDAVTGSEELYVFKVVRAGSETGKQIREKSEFIFELYYGTTTEFDDAVQVDLTTHPVHPGHLRVGSSNRFRVLNDDQNGINEVAYFSGLPLDLYYWVVEIDVGLEGHETPPIFYVDGEKGPGIETGPPINGFRTDWFEIDGSDFGVTFYNVRETGNLTIKKSIGPGVPDDELFEFVIYDFPLGSGKPLPLEEVTGVLYPIVTIKNASGADVTAGRIQTREIGGVDGPFVLQLMGGDTAVISGLPTGNYGVEEITRGYSTSYTIGGGQSRSGRTTQLIAVPGAVTFTNNIPTVPETPETPETPTTPGTPGTPDRPDTPDTPDRPDTPDTPDTPGTPGTPGTPDTPTTPIDPWGPPFGGRDPSTGDNRDPTSAIAMIMLGINFIMLAEITRRVAKRKSRKTGS